MVIVVHLADNSVNLVLVRLIVSVVLMGIGFRSVLGHTVLHVLLIVKHVVQ